MFYKNHLFLMVVFFSIALPVRAELLIVKKQDGKFAALSQQDIKKYGAVISRILQKYQWPMCTASDLTEQEKSELLAPGKPYGEELFIQKKLNEELGNALGELGVVFIPTALYELFCINHFFKNKKSNLRSVVKQWIWFDRGHCGQAVNLEPILNKDAEVVMIHQEINDAYSSVNDRFMLGSDSALLEVHKEYVSVLFDWYPELKQCCNAFEVSQVLKEKSSEMVQRLIDSVTVLQDSMDFFPRRMDCALNDDIKSMAHSLNVDANKSMIQTFIQHEYKSRKKNKALLVRGTSCREFNIELGGKSVKYPLIGNTFSDYQCKYVYDEKAGYERCKEISLTQAYEEGIIHPYTISFGSSLFAGFIKDKTACAYYFLRGKRVYKATSDTIAHVAGFCVFLDKQEYVNNRNSKLFFVPPLAPVASLFSNGEYFHARSTAATMKKTDQQDMRGLYSDVLKDPAGIILIERDPLEHAALFSEFVAKHGKIIQRGDEKDLSDEDKQKAKKILENQAQAARDYRAMKAVLAAFKKPKPKSEE